MNAITREVSDLQSELLRLKAGDSYLRAVEDNDVYFSIDTWEVISTDNAIYKLKTEINKRNKTILSYQKKIAPCRGHIERLIDTNWWTFIFYKRSIRRDLINRIDKLKED